ncbi:uncharacterized protein At1g65710 [Ananas comosus]|uniref:Uncharacterized protein At1g65710 n=1 Tax=Ananas comosus TaxID=4615 RepID=A0A6P5EKN4_ANACO|nr:uncharacterized protein At1g65710 [Ananas comosus]
MGLCFSKKKKSPPPPNSPSSSKPIAVEKKIDDKKKKQQQQQQQQEMKPTTIPSSKSLSGKAAATVAAAAEKKPPVFVITQSIKNSPSAATAAAAEEKEKKKKTNQPEAERNCSTISATAAADEAPPVAVRTSSCSKEEVDAILIQCGRLSRSSSGKLPSADTAGHRRYSGSKRSFDFDHEKKLGPEELDDAGEPDKRLSRPSPRRRTPGRDRSGSRERATGGGGGSGSRRVSRSPSRRSDCPASSASAGERPKQPQQQPAKLVSVPAREKEAGVKRASPVKPKRCASPRSQSPANSARIGNENVGLNRAPQLPAQPQSLSRSSSRKAEQSPYRRNPMAEIDENSLRANNCKVSKSPRKGDDGVRKLNQTESQKSSENNTVPLRKSEIVEEALEVKGSSKSNAEAHSTTNVTFETLNPRAVTQNRSSRRSSRDFDQNLGYTSLLLEDIQNYHHHHNNTAFSLPACVSKACSILEAVADLNSSSSENDKGSFNGRFGKRGSVPREPIFESEIVVKDDLMEPSLHKYVSVRDLGGGGGGGGEMEPQESAGSNSFLLGQPWAASSWEPNSVDSTDQYSASQSINGEEEVEQENRVNGGGRRSRGGSNGSNIVAVNTGGKKREIGGDQQQQQRRVYRGGSSVSASASARSGTRALSVPGTAAAQSS